jgi:nuclear pore complex protein Nup205
LNELVCVELLVAAVERGAPPEQCLKPAAGMFLRERQNRVESLERLLRETLRNTGLSSQNQTRDFRDDRASLARVVDSFVADILTGVGGRTLIGRLCELLASPFPGDLAAAEAKASGAYVVQTPGGTAATPGGGVVPYGGNDVAGSGGSGVTGLLSDAAIAAAAADMTHVVDERGRLCRKKDWLAHERKLLAECLHRAVALAKRIHPSGSNTEANQKCLAARDDFESLARLFAETASPVLATAAADVRARAAATESAAAVGGGPTGPGANERGGSQRSFGPSAAGGGRFSNSAFGSNGAGGRSGSLEEPPSLSAAEARVGCIDELGDLAAGVADELPAALAILFATLEAVTTETGVAASGASSFSEAAAVAAAAAAFGPVLASASAAAAAQFRRARDGDDADAAAEMAAANPLRSAALGGGFGGLMFGRSQDRSAADDAAAEVSCARAEILELSRFTRGLAVLFATSSGTSGTSTNDASGRETTVEAAKKEIVAASDEGALVSLRCVLATGAFRDENEFSRRAYLDLSLKILRSAMRAALHDADLGDALAAVTPAMTAEQIAREERHAASADDFANRANRAQDNAFDAYGVPAYGHDGPVGNDDNDVHFSEGERLRAMREDEDSVREAPLVALCRALAEAYRQSPESARRDVSENLAERPNRGDSSETRSNQPPLRVFLDAICEWEHGVESLAAALEVLAALAASGDAGARDVWERLRAPPEGAAAAWDHFLGAVAGYNRRFAFGDVEDETVTGDAPYRAATARGAFGGSTDGGLDARAVSSDREMPEADVQGMVAYLDVLTRCLGGGDGDEPRSSSRVSASGAEARDRVAWLSQRCGGSFLDALMRLHANPVPSRLKAALLKCAGAAAGDSAAGAAEAWARMEAAAILQTRANLSLSSSSGAFAFDDAAGYDGGARAHDRFHEQRDGRGGYGRGGVDFDDQAFRAFADGGYGAAAAARQRWLHERRAFEGAERSAAARDQLAVPGADLAYELAYSEARARTYPHASSYVRLVNKLMRACEGGRVGPCADAGRASFAQFAFVRDRVFGELRRRRHNSQEERWWLARDALEHFRIQLRVWRDAVRSGDEDASLAAVDGGRFESGRRRYTNVRRDETRADEAWTVGTRPPNGSRET